MTLTNGQLLAQRYRLSRRIAIGGMGEVWEAADIRLERRVAVKVLKPELSGDAEFRYRFHTEARMTASLNHPGIAAVHDYGEREDDPGSAYSGAYPWAYLVMELIAGDPLATILMRHPRLPVDRTLDVLVQAADALQAAHQRGLVHRDIKPGNILITPAGTVKLTDFGIARAVDAAPVTRHGMVMGTAHYIAPEQAAGQEAGPAGDVYSLAVVGYECLAGRRPFLADNAVTVAMMHIHDWPPPLPPDVPAQIRALIEAALVKDPRQRYGTGGEFAAAVAAVRAGHRLPLPVGMAARSAGNTGVIGREAGNHPAPTALLPLGGANGPHTADTYRPQQHRDRRGTARIAMALVGVLALMLSGYLVNDALRSDVASSGATAGVGSAGTIPVPAAPVIPQPGIPQPGIPQPFQRLPTEKQFPSERTGPTERLLGVLIVPTDYLRESGNDAVVTAKTQGLVPRVVDENGDQVDRDRRSRCRVTGVRPLAGYVPRGSTLELTCRRLR
ncbi:MAG: serine/threonine protein kinase [Actinomycetota bacterium]|nr:serine/threonine protein kinase [Actinomycetota bacterium]